MEEGTEEGGSDRRCNHVMEGGGIDRCRNSPTTVAIAIAIRLLNAVALSFLRSGGRWASRHLVGVRIEMWQLAGFETDWLFEEPNMLPFGRGLMRSTH